MPLSEALIDDEHDLPWIQIEQRRLVVVGGHAFYCSTGSNSGCQGVWLPILGLYDGETEASLAHTIAHGYAQNRSAFKHFDPNIFQKFVNKVRHNPYYDKGYIFKYELGVLNNDFKLRLSYFAIDNNSTNIRYLQALTLKHRIPLDEHLAVSAQLNAGALQSLLEGLYERKRALERQETLKLAFEENGDESIDLHKGQHESGEYYEIQQQITRLEKIFQHLHQPLRLKREPDQVFYPQRFPQAHECVEAARYANRWLAHQGARPLKKALNCYDVNLDGYQSFYERIQSFQFNLTNYIEKQRELRNMLTAAAPFFYANSGAPIYAARKLHNISNYLVHDIGMASVCPPTYITQQDVHAFAQDGLKPIVEEFRAIITDNWCDELRERLSAIVDRFDCIALQRLLGQDTYILPQLGNRAKVSGSC